MRKSFYSFMLSLLVGTVASAKSVYVGTIKGVSVSEGDLAAVEELIRTAVAESLKHRVANAAADADYAISGRLVKLGEAYTLTLIKTKNNDEVFRSSLKSSMMSDMDVVVGRLVRAIEDETKADENASVKDVTFDEERNQRRRRDVLSQWVFAVGPATTSNLNIEGSSILWNFGYNYEIDYDWDMHLDLDWLTTQRASENDAYFTGLNFGLNHYFTSDNHGPFVEGHLGYGMAIASTGCSSQALICSSKDRASGWLAGLGLGYRFFRTAKTNFAVMARGSVLGDETDISGERPAMGSLMLVGFFHYD